MKFMKILTLVLLATGLQTFAAEPVKIDLNHVATKVSNENLNVYANALKVYQAKEAIKVARMNLLPKLNLWRLIGAAAGVIGGGASTNPVAITSGALTIIEDIAPFLIPSNWIAVKQAKILYNADMEGFRALWANEVMNAKGLYMHAVFDGELLAQINKHKDSLSSIQTLVKLRETLGGAPIGASREIEIRMLALQEDSRALEVLLNEEKSLLAFMLGYTTTTQLDLAAIEMPDFDTLVPLVYSDFEFRAVDTSPEIRQFNYFIAAAGLVKQQVLYSFLGASTLSVGANGGVFDHIPIQDGLGFGAGASMRIVSAQKEILKAQQKGAVETVKRQLNVLVGNYNLDIENYLSLSKRSQLTQKSLEQQYERLKLGQDVESLELIEASRNMLQADTALVSVKYRFLFSEDRLARLIFYGDYTKKPILIDKLKKKEQP